MNETSDIYFASFIWASGFKKYSTKSEEDKRKAKMRVVFTFEISDEKFKELKQSFFDGSGQCSALEFMNGYRNLKNMCFLN